MFGSHRLLLSLVAALVTTAAVTAQAQTPEELFDAGTMQDIRLTVNARDLQDLHADYLENTFYPAELEWRNVRLRNVAIRSRGTGSRNPVKLGLKIEFDRYVSGQTFLGLETLVLDNLWQDPALIRESVTMALFARLGQPAPRESYARLFINGAYQGLYALVEPVDAAFLARTYGVSSGYVFEFQYVRPFYAEYLGTSLAPYKELFKPDTHDTESDSVLYAPIHDMLREINEPDSAIWRESVDRYVDVPQFLTHVAIETFVSELDGLLGYAGMNNFYLYRAAGSTRHQFIVWDRDNAFQQVDSPMLQRADQNVLFRRLIAYDDLRAFYLQVLDACARTAAEDGWLEHEVSWRASLIDAAAHEDDHKAFSNDEFDEGITFLTAFAHDRSGIVASAVDALRESSDVR